MKRRASWRVDAKWIAGILFTTFLITFTVLFNLYQLTSFKQAKSITGAMLDEPISQFVDQGYSQIMTFAQANPEQILESPEEVPFKIKLKGKDIAGMTPKQLRKYIVNRVTKQVYNEGLESAISERQQSPQELSQEQQIPPLGIGYFTQSEEGQAQKSKLIPPSMFRIMSLFTAKSNQLFGTLLIASIIFTLLFLGLLVGFSYRFGKVLSPGICLSFVGFGGTLAFSPARLGTAFLPNGKYSNILKEATTTVFTTYVTLLIFGAVLMAIGMVGGFIFWITHNKKQQIITLKGRR